jgi:hypothetical protein
MLILRRLESVGAAFGRFGVVDRSAFEAYARPVAAEETLRRTVTFVCDRCGRTWPQEQRWTGDEWVNAAAPWGACDPCVKRRRRLEALRDTALVLWGS